MSEFEARAAELAGVLSERDAQLAEASAACEHSARRVAASKRLLHSMIEERNEARARMAEQERVHAAEAEAAALDVAERRSQYDALCISHAQSVATLELRLARQRTEAEEENGRWCDPHPRPRPRLLHPHPHADRGRGGEGAPPPVY